MAVKLVIEPIFEADFCPCSYGFRPKRSAQDAMDAIAEALHTGHSRVIDADLSQYFDSIPHAKLMATVAERICDGAVLHLIQMWIKAPVVEVDEKGKRRTVGGGKASRRGTPQGGVISPLLSNLAFDVRTRIGHKTGKPYPHIQPSGKSLQRCRRQRDGRMRMPCGEGHRKAVCGKTARTV